MLLAYQQLLPGTASRTGWARGAVHELDLVDSVLAEWSLCRQRADQQVGDPAGRGIPTVRYHDANQLGKLSGSRPVNGALHSDRGAVSTFATQFDQHLELSIPRQITRASLGAFVVISGDQRDRFRDEGFLGPIDLMSPEEMDRTLFTLDQVLAAPGRAPQSADTSGRLAALVADRSGGPVPYVECRHLDSPAVFQLATHPLLLAAARTLYGEDLVLWRSTFIEKGAGGPRFHWHQDWGGVFGPYEDCYGLEPPLSFTFWIALTEATEANGCLWFVPGVRRVLRQVPASDGPNATLLAAAEDVAAADAVPVRLRPGQCVVFTDRALHGSPENTTDTPRRGLAVRFTLPSVRVRSHFSGHACVLISGRDTVGLNTMVEAPTAEPSELVRQ